MNAEHAFGKNQIQVDVPADLYLLTSHRGQQVFSAYDPSTGLPTTERVAFVLSRELQARSIPLPREGVHAIENGAAAVIPVGSDDTTETLQAKINAVIPQLRALRKQ